MLMGEREAMNWISCSKLLYHVVVPVLELSDIILVGGEGGGVALFRCAFVDVLFSVLVLFTKLNNFPCVVY